MIQTSYLESAVHKRLIELSSESRKYKKSCSYFIGTKILIRLRVDEFGQYKLYLEVNDQTIGHNWFLPNNGDTIDVEILKELFTHIV